MNATSLTNCIRHANADRLKTLIVGAGVAGLTLAALMRQRGESPILIERSANWRSGGYMLGLYPIGSRVLHGLGLYDRYLSQSTTMNQYQVCDGHGSVIQSYDLKRLTQRFGPMQGIERSTLIEILAEGIKDLPIHTKTTVKSLTCKDDKVAVTFHDDTSADFDLVVGADGLHSDTRSMILDQQEYHYWDSKWGGWVFWADPSLVPSDVYRECWGAGHFVGLYPTKTHLGVFVGGPIDTINQMGKSGFIDYVQSQFGTSAEPIPHVLKAARNDQDSFFWSFHDCRSHHWRNGRVILLGDAAAGFLPTAGVGASMAMESAAALSDELSRTNAERVEQALDLYEKRHRQRVEEAQKNSRELARIMFVQSKPVDWLREQLLKFYSVENLIRSIARIMEEPI